MDILSIVLMFSSGKKKAYPYFVSGALCLVYSILYSISTKPPSQFIDTAAYEIIYYCEMFLPVILFITVLALSKNEKDDGKRNYLPAVLAGMICVARIVRFFWIRHYHSLIRNAGAAVFELTDLGTQFMNINTIVMSFLFFILNIALLWHLKNYHSIKSVTT